MSTVDALGATATSNATVPSGFSTLNSDQFMKIILTELSKQDPMKPNDSSALLQQLSTIRSIQSSVDLSDKLGALVNQNEMASAAGLIGKVVAGLAEDNTRVTDRVASVNRTSSGTVLTLAGGQRVPMKDVDQIVADSVLTTGAGQ